MPFTSRCCCRYARLHEPLILLREMGWKAALRAIACYALPPGTIPGQGPDDPG